MPGPDEYLRIRAAAKEVGGCRATLRNGTTVGKIPVRRHPVSTGRLY